MTNTEKISLHNTKLRECIETAENLPDASSGSGASLNIAYGDTEPNDTTKLWVKGNEPSKVSVGVMEGGTEEFRASVGALPKAMSEIGVASVGNKIYMFGGLNSNGHNTIIVFDTKTKTTETLTTTLPNNAYGVGTARVGTKIYLFGGYHYIGSEGPNYHNTINVFDTETNNIETLTTKLPESMKSIATVAVGEKIYLFGGCSGSNVYSSAIYAFNTKTNSISSAGSLPSPVDKIGVASVGTKIYLFGGEAKTSSNNFNTIYMYDTETSQITNVGSLSGKTYGIGASSVGTKIYLFGGQEYPTTYLDAIKVFDTQTNTLTTLSAKLPAISREIPTTVVGANIYLCGGMGKVNGVMTYLDTIHEFIVALSLDNGTMQIATNGDNLWQMLNTDTVTAEIGVKDVYIGNADGVAEKVPSALFKDGAWVEI